MSYLQRLLRGSSPLAAYAAAHSWNDNKQQGSFFQQRFTACDASKDSTDANKKAASQTSPNIDEVEPKEELFHGLFPKRQLWKPRLEYPLWDSNWDNKKPESTGDKRKDHEYNRWVRKNGVTRHIILVRHGQYDETHKEDEKRILTPLGRKQAELTGKRINEMIQGINKDFGPCNVKVVRVSALARAIETADIIANELPDSIERIDPDPLLNEGRPCHTIPCGRVGESTIKKTDEGHARIEEAFQKYFYRADAPSREAFEEDKATDSDSNENENDDSKEEELVVDPHHEFEIIVCHANVIRYFMCRSLQIPPEAWLRMCTFNCSLNYLTIRPTGSVSVRMLGDIGHLGYEHSTFSMHHGFNW